MTIHIWHTKKLAADLAHGRVTERDGMKYMLVQSLVYAYTYYWNLWFGTYRDLSFFVELAIFVAIALIGIIECYKANGEEKGNDFILRYCALAVPVGVKVAIAGLVLGQVLYFGSDYVLAEGAFRDPELVYRQIFFVLPLALAFLYYWRIAHHIRAVRVLRADLERPINSGERSTERIDT